MTMRKVLAALVCITLAFGVALSAQAKGVNITGKWAFDVQTDGGGGTPTMTFKQEGEKLTGHYSGQFGERDFTGTVKGSDVKFSFTMNAQGQDIDAVYTGTIVDKDSMKGTVALAGGQLSGTFTAKRQ
jgi:hypothetical protein